MQTTLIIPPPTRQQALVSDQYKYNGCKTRQGCMPQSWIYKWLLTILTIMHYTTGEICGKSLTNYTLDECAITDLNFL